MTVREAAARGPRVHLARLTVEDIDDRVVSWFQIEDLTRFYSGRGRRYVRDEMICEMESAEAAGTLFTYGVFLNDDLRLIGTLRMGPLDRRHRISDMPLIIGERPADSKGLAVEAIRLGNEIAFEIHDIRKLFGGMFEANTAAIRAYSRAGWVEEGRLIGHYLVDGKPMDRILYACFNPRYFPTVTAP